MTATTNELQAALSQQQPLRDYYCAATVRLAKAPKEVQVTLWTRHIQAENYPAAREGAKAAIAGLGLEWTALDVMAADATAMVIR